MLTAEHYLVYAEPLLTLAVLVIFVRAGFARRFPAMRNYLGMRVGSTFALEAILNLQYVVPVAATTQYYIYFYTYWISFLISAVLIFFVLKEIYSELMRPVPGLRGLGMMAFRWVVAISGINCNCFWGGVWVTEDAWRQTRLYRPSRRSQRERAGTLSLGVPCPDHSQSGALFPEPALWDRARPWNPGSHRLYA